MTWEGKTYCYFMYVCGTGTPGCTTNETHYGHGLVAVASDGVHFQTHSAFNAGVSPSPNASFHRLASLASVSLVAIAAFLNAKTLAVDALSAPARARAAHACAGRMQNNLQVTSYNLLHVLTVPAFKQRVLETATRLFPLV